MKISISTNFPDIQRRLDRMTSDVRNKALVSAVNKTMDQAKTQMGREIVSEYNVTSAYVRDRLAVSRASIKGGGFNVSASLTGSGRNRKSRSANLIAFMEKFVTLAQSRKRAKQGDLNQLRFQIRKAGGKKVIKGAFVGNRGRTVFIRTGDARLPIKALSTIDVPSMFNQKRINARIVGLIAERFPVLFDRDAKFFTDQFNKP